MFSYNYWELIQSLWERDFKIQDYKKLLISIDDMKDQYRRVRNELCHNQHKCFFSSNSVTVFKTGRKRLVDEINILTSVSYIGDLESLLKIIK